MEERQMILWIAFPARFWQIDRFRSSTQEHVCDSDDRFSSVYTLAREELGWVVGVEKVRKCPRDNDEKPIL
jgi:hypothetical protein